MYTRGVRRIFEKYHVLEECRIIRGPLFATPEITWVLQERYRGLAGMLRMGCYRSVARLFVMLQECYRVRSKKCGPLSVTPAFECLFACVCM
jgi:hypothetical protein